MKKERCFAVVTFIFVSLCWITVLEKEARAGALFIGPSSYLSFTNGFFSTNGFDYFHLETLEDGALNTPGITPGVGWLVANPGNLTDSVDGDDGSVDGSGTNGRSLYSTGSQTNFTVTFNAASLGGHLPTHAGIVCTDIGDVFFGQLGFGNVIFSARNSNGEPLGSIVATNFGNGSVAGNGVNATSEDRFFGVINPGGISSISITAENSQDWEVDHLQYGYVPPLLRIELSELDTVIVAWPTNAVGFSLQQNSSLTTTNWETVTNLPVVIGDENRVSVTPLSSNNFYRLIAP
jgi:hypothetical protein